MSLVTLGRGQARRGVYEKVVTDTGYGKSYSQRLVGYETGEVVVMIDADQILHSLGPKALSNRSGKSKALRGAVVVKVVSRKQEDAA